MIVFLMIQSGDKFAYVTTAQLSWHMQNCNLWLDHNFLSKSNMSFYKIWIVIPWYVGDDLKNWIQCYPEPIFDLF